MKDFKYSIEVRDENNKQFMDVTTGKKAGYFHFYEKEEDENFVKLICEREFRNYRAISGSSNINIEVSVLNSFTRSYMVLYSFYGAENKFVKHS